MTDFSETNPFGCWFDDLQIGYRWRSRGRTVTETDIVLFAMWSGDWFPVHTDREYAAATLGGRRTAHGFLVLSMASGMMQPGDYSRAIALYGLDRARWTKPVKVDETITVELEVSSLQRKHDGGVVGCAMTVVNQNGEPVLVCELRSKQRLRPESGEGKTRHQP